MLRSNLHRPLAFAVVLSCAFAGGCGASATTAAAPGVDTDGGDTGIPPADAGPAHEGGGVDAGLPNPDAAVVTADAAPRPSAIPSAFAAYCTGVLSVQKGLVAAAGPGAWGTSVGSAEPGTSFLLALRGQVFTGYVFAANGSVTKLTEMFSTGLVRGTEFTSACTVDASAAARTMVVLTPSTIYAAQDLSGTACPLEPGFELRNFSFVVGSTATFSSPDLMTKCGFTKGYSRDMVYGSPIRR